jgi:hypothetical protein
MPILVKYFQHNYIFRESLLLYALLQFKTDSIISYFQLKNGFILIHSFDDEVLAPYYRFK